MALLFIPPTVVSRSGNAIRSGMHLYRPIAGGLVAEDLLNGAREAEGYRARWRANNIGSGWTRNWTGPTDRNIPWPVKVGVFAQTIAPAGVLIAESAGTLAAHFRLLMAGAAVGEAVGAPQLNFRLPAVGAVLVTEALGEMAVRPGVVAVAPDGLLVGEAMGDATVRHEPTRISPDGVAVLEAVGQTALHFILRMVGVPVPDAPGTPTVLPGTATVQPPGLSVPEQIGAVLVQGGEALRRLIQRISISLGIRP